VSIGTLGTEVNQGEEMELEVNTNNSSGKEDPTSFRNLVKQVSGREITSVQAQQFLDVFEDDLKVAITKTKRSFIEKHFGK
jgi:hypothetical protein